MIQHMLTTIDNPYDPFTQFNEWLAWDTRSGYNTPNLLARVVQLSDEMSEADQHLAIERGIDDLVDLNPSGVLRKVSKDVQVGES